MLKHLKFVGNNLVMDLGDARPVDGKAFRSSAEFLKVRSLTMMATSDEPSPSTWIPATVRTVHLTGDGGDRSNAVTLTKALVAQAPATLEDIFTPRLMLEEFDTAMPDWSRRGRVLSRVRALGYPVCLRRFLPKGSTLGEQWWRRVCDRPGAAEFSRFLTSLDISLTALGQLPQDTARRQQCATQVQRLIRALTAAPELLDELQADLAVAAPCVDAKMLLLNQFDLYLFPDIAAQEPAGALVRMALFQAVDRHVALTDDRAENIERGQALRALVDFRLAALARKRFQHTPRPWYRKIAGMNAVSWFRPNAGPASSDWPPEMHKAVDRILGEQVRAGFPEVRELLSATSGPIARVADRLREDPAYRKARLAWEAAFLEAGERAESAHAMPEDQERYARLQAEMPDRQAQHQLALMKEWLDPLRKAYPMSGRA
ncbi:hypothetical protein [Roseateles chitinivorans]|uniref:hypothetical protein n=1 Tax=Roseateles chitinivorans TaxID=2917965 RepID=UPI003D6735ED